MHLDATYNSFEYFFLQLVKTNFFPSDYFMLNEAKINEIRATEDLHYISQPFYFTYNPEKFQYEIGLPTLKRHDGRVIIPCEKKCIAYYACPLHSENQQTEHKEPKNKLDVSGQDDILLARLVNRNTLYSRGKLNPVRNNYFFAAANDVDAYNNKCESQVRPRIRVAQESGDTATQYEIIFDVSKCHCVEWTTAEYLCQLFSNHPIYILRCSVSNHWSLLKYSSIKKLWCQFIPDIRFMERR